MTLTLDPAIAARLKRTADGPGARGRAAARHRRGADARLDGRRGAGPHADDRPGDVLEPLAAGVLGQGRDLRPPASGSRRSGSTATATPCWSRSTRRAPPATPATAPASTPTCCRSRWPMPEPRAGRSARSCCSALASRDARPRSPAARPGSSDVRRRGPGRRDPLVPRRRTPARCRWRRAEPGACSPAGGCCW